MGLGSFVKKGLGAISTGGLSLLGGGSSGISNVLGTGDSAARRDGIAYAEKLAQIYQDQFDLNKPNVELGTEQLSQLGEYSTAEGLGGLYDELSGSDLANSMIADRTEAAEQALSNAGLRRSGTRVDTAASIPNDVLSGLMNTIIGNTQNTASLGLGQGSQSLGALGGLSNSLMSAYGIQQGGADRKTDLLGGLFSGGMNMLGGILSDRRLKTNIKKVGVYGPLDVFSWDWVDQIAANDEIVSVMTTGFMADEVLKVFPQHVHPISFQGHDILTVDYDGVFEEVRHAV